MRNDAYLKRNGMDPHTFLEPGRYVKGALHSHKRPVQPKLVNRKSNLPSKRGLIQDYEE